MRSRKAGEIGARTNATILNAPRRGRNTLGLAGAALVLWAGLWAGEFKGDFTDFGRVGMPAEARSEDEVLLVRSVPAAVFAGKQEEVRVAVLEPVPGSTKVYCRIPGKDGLSLKHTYPWYWFRLVCDRHQEDASVIRLAYRVRTAEEPDEQLGIAFYCNGAARQEYSVRELIPAVVGGPAWRRGLMPIRSVKGYDKGGSPGAWSFTLETCDYRRITYNPRTGLPMSVRDRIMECTNQAWFAAALVRIRETARGEGRAVRLIVGSVTQVVQLPGETRGSLREGQSTPSVLVAPARDVGSGECFPTRLIHTPAQILKELTIRDGELWGFLGEVAPGRLGPGSMVAESACRLYPAEVPTKHDVE